jgi:hypothetical protein
VCRFRSDAETSGALPGPTIGSRTSRDSCSLLRPLATLGEAAAGSEVDHGYRRAVSAAERDRRLLRGYRCGGARRRRLCHAATAAPRDTGSPRGRDRCCLVRDHSNGDATNSRVDPGDRRVPHADRIVAVGRRCVRADLLRRSRHRRHGRGPICPRTRSCVSEGAPHARCRGRSERARSF